MNYVLSLFNASSAKRWEKEWEKPVEELKKNCLWPILIPVDSGAMWVRWAWRDELTH